MYYQGSWNHTREGERGARAVLVRGWLYLCFTAAVAHFCSCGVPCGDKNAHGIPFEAIPLAPSHVGGE